MEVKIKHFFAWENRVGGFAASDSQILAGTPQPESLGSTSSRRIFLSVFFAVGSRLCFCRDVPLVFLHKRHDMQKRAQFDGAIRVHPGWSEMPR